MNDFPACLGTTAASHPTNRGIPIAMMMRDGCFTIGSDDTLVSSSSDPAINLASDLAGPGMHDATRSTDRSSSSNCEPANSNAATGVVTSQLGGINEDAYAVARTLMETKDSGHYCLYYSFNSSCRCEDHRRNDRKVRCLMPGAIEKATSPQDFI